MPQTKFKVGKYYVPVNVIIENDRFWFDFKYNAKVIEEIKTAMEGRKYHGFDTPPRKIWSAPITQRNIFVINYLQGKNPYVTYDQPLLEYSTKRTLYQHQIEMVRHAITRHKCVFACEMGTGKTLAMIEAMEWAAKEYNLAPNESNFWYIGPKSGVAAVNLELKKWHSGIRPLMLTYAGMVKEVRSKEQPAPFFVCFDESARLKTPGSQRSQVAKYLAASVRREHENGFILAMSGAPAPKSPIDWWNQCEIVCPGFLREGNINEFKKNLCIIEERESQAGGMYPHIVTWLDDEHKCSICGQMDSSAVHIDPLKHKDTDEVIKAVVSLMQGQEAHVPVTEIKKTNAEFHEFVASKNEVGRMYKKMDGLVLIKRKKYCLDLPEKQYKIIRIKPNVDTLRVAKTLAKTISRKVTLMMKLRELSDGFQYSEIADGKETCPNCQGSGEERVYELCDSGSQEQGSQEQGSCDSGSQKQGSCNSERLELCSYCNGTKEVDHFSRSTTTITSRKDEVFLDLLEDHEDIGRFIVWGGFTATIDKLIDTCHKQGWHTLRLDKTFLGESDKGNVIDYNELLISMDRSHYQYNELLDKYPKVCVVGHPKAGGTAVTLTASPTEFYYSNDFDGDARIQSEDRFHRPGMDENKGATIIDCIHLPTDELVLNNLKQKKTLQDITMNEINEYLEKEYDYDKEW